MSLPVAITITKYTKYKYSINVERMDISAGTLGAKRKTFSVPSLF